MRSTAPGKSPGSTRAAESTPHSAELRIVDAMFSSAKGGGAEVGPTKRGKGVKIMGIVDREGLPLSVSTHAANHHEVTLVQWSFEFYMIEATPEHLIGDKAYDSDPLDAELKVEGVEMIAPHRKIGSGARHRTVGRYIATRGGGRSSALLPGSNGSAVL